MTQTILYNDHETFSRAILVGQKAVGGYRYARDPSTRNLMTAYAFDDGKVQQWVPAEGEKMPRDLREAIRDPHVIKSAWNAPFEKVIWEYVLDEEIRHEEWRCSMVRAFSMSFPGALDKAGAIVNLDSDAAKDKEGKKLIRLFCGPQKPSKKNPFERANHYTHPEEWEKFKSYNKQDVVAERAFCKRTKKWDLPDHEWELWALDQEINHDGIPINMDAVDAAIAFVEEYKGRLLRRMAKITGVDNPKSNAQLLDWLRDHGYRFDDMKKGHVQTASTDEELSEKVRKVLTMRLEVSRTSTDKYYAMKRSQTDGVVQGALQFAGAQRTWRWSGRIFQPQNLPRPDPSLEKEQEAAVKNLVRFKPRQLEMLYPKPMDFLATCIRPSIQAPEGQALFSADLNAIENRVLGYLSGDEKILNVFRKGRDPYIDFAGYMFDTDYETEAAFYDNGDGDKSHRTISKPGVLGCGYMLSAGKKKLNKKTGEVEASGLLGYAWNMGVKQFTQEDATLSVRVWRETFSDAVEYWWEIEKAAKKCLQSQKKTWAGPVSFEMSGPFMLMNLPSGRSLKYCRPKLEQSITYWCNVNEKYLPKELCEDINKRKFKEKTNITYEGLNDRSAWGRIWTHPGKLTENADQAISRDLLAEAMRRFRRRVPRREGRIQWHVHDELVGMGPEKYAERNYKILVECMSEPMPWATEDELPLAAKGGISTVWIKD